ncbi:MAG: MFS transporter [Firmicutes bacterium]|nr:MFS transporter [Alicyclobacillaceae bacterium]MCL6496231.1 MFS transporter [Bacillota bacterium]
MDGTSREVGAIPGPDRARTRSIIGGMIGMFVDTWDIYLPAFVLPAALGYFIPTTLPVAVRATLGSLIFTVALIGRPLGSVIMGHLGDKWGRRYVGIVAGIGFTLVTLLIGLLPGYAAWGYLSPALMIFLRLVGGIFLSSGYAGPIPLALERAPKSARGWVAGVVSSTSALAVMLTNLFMVILTANVSSQAFLRWGWRLPFFFGVLLGLGYLLFFLRVPEQEAVLESRREHRPRQPLREFFNREQGKVLLQVFLLTTGFWLAAQPVLSFTPGLLITVLHQSPKAVSLFEFWSNIPAIAFVILFGALSQVLGRRRFLIAMGGWFMVLSTLFYYLMIHFARHGGGFALWVVGGLAIFLTDNPLAPVILYLAERFPVQLRSTGVSIPYQFGLIIPSLYSFWLLGLSAVMPYAYTPLVLIALGGAMVLVAGLMGPETRDWDLIRREETPASA